MPFTAQLFIVRCKEAEFHVAATVDGSIDLAVPKRTFLLSKKEAKQLAEALLGAVSDIDTNLKK